METTLIPKGFKTNIRENGESTYYIEEERQNPDSEVRNSLYGHVNWLEDQTIFESGDQSLEHLKEEIKARLKISQHEIFKTGELLTQAKKICRQEAVHFKQWINDNFEFSYETANNFMNVYKYCFGFHNYVFKIPISILYKICSSSFPDELRDFLFTEGNLEKMTNGNLLNLISKFKEGGIEAIEEDIEEYKNNIIIDRQTRFTFDLVENTLRTIESNKLKIHCRGGTIRKYNIEFRDHTESFLPEAEKISMILYEGFITAYEILEKANSDAIKIFNVGFEKIQAKM